MLDVEVEALWAELRLDVSALARIRAVLATGRPMRECPTIVDVLERLRDAEADGDAAL